MDKHKTRWFSIIKRLLYRRSFDSNDNLMIKNYDIAAEVEQLLEARDMKVSEIMIPRADVVAISITSSIQDIKEKFLETKFLRLLLYRNDLDDIVGLIYLKDFFAFLFNKDKEHKDFAINNILRKTIYAARSTKCFTLFNKMKQENVDIAVILDEYGGIEGVISIEKLMEQIMNTIQNNDNEEIQANVSIQQLNDREYILDARTSIQKVEELFEDVEFLSEEEGKYETIGGFILSYLDRIPLKGEKFNHIGGIEVEIIESTNRAIKKIKITRIKI